MEKQYEYVHEKFRHLVTANNQERIEFLDEPRWVGYADANKIIENKFYWNMIEYHSPENSY